MVAVGIVSVSDDGTKLEYRMLTARPEAGLNDQEWARSGVLATRPAHDPFNIMSVALPTGDSVLLTLQDMSRPKNTVQIQQFVNHCPFGDPPWFDRMTQQQSATIRDLENWPHIRPPVGTPLGQSTPANSPKALPGIQEDNRTSD